LAAGGSPFAVFETAVSCAPSSAVVCPLGCLGAVVPGAAHVRAGSSGEVLGVDSVDADGSGT